MNGVNGDRLFYISKTIALVQKIVSYAIANDEHNQIKYAFKVLTGILESSKGKIDHILPDLVSYVTEQVKVAKKQDHKQALVELVFIYYSIQFFVF